MPGSLGSRPRLSGASMYARKGYEATEMRSRGAVGKDMCGSRTASAKTAGALLAINRPADTAENPSRNLRRVRSFICFPFARNYSLGSAAQCTPAVEVDYLVSFGG